MACEVAFVGGLPGSPSTALLRAYRHPDDHGREQRNNVEERGPDDLGHAFQAGRAVGYRPRECELDPDADHDGDSDPTGRHPHDQDKRPDLDLRRTDVTTVYALPDALTVLERGASGH